jgi:hypothetical protein
MKTLSEVTPGDLLDYGAYGVCRVGEVESRLGGWNGQVPLTTITFTCGLGFTADSGRAARLAYACTHCGALIDYKDGPFGLTWYHYYGRHQCDGTGNQPTFANPAQKEHTS